VTRALHRDVLDAAPHSLQTGGMSPSALTRGSGPEASTSGSDHNTSAA
jgi:hypothetical protein